MSMYHFGNDNDMNLYPPHDWGELYDVELLCAEIEGQMFVDANDAVEQVKRLQEENDKLKAENERLRELAGELSKFVSKAELLQWPELSRQMDEFGIEV